MAMRDWLKGMLRSPAPSPDEDPGELEKPLYAVWDYDLFPFYLCAEVISLSDTGTVRVKGYEGMVFQPVALLNNTKGKEVRAYLDAARAAHHNMTEGVENSTRAALSETLCKLGVPGASKHTRSGFQYGALQSIYRELVAEVLNGQAPGIAPPSKHRAIVRAKDLSAKKEK